MKAIETKYAGHRFRSRLEARWAVFFDSAGIEWTYEPEGFEFEDGTRYLPDFLLTKAKTRGCLYPPDVYVEVKGLLTKEDEHKVHQLSKHCGVVILGDLPRHGRRRTYPFFAPWKAPARCEWVYWDRSNQYAPDIKPEILLGPAQDEDSDILSWRRIDDAFDKARSARFEFGEEG